MYKFIHICYVIIGCRKGYYGGLFLTLLYGNYKNISLVIILLVVPHQGMAEFLKIVNL